MKKGLVVGVVMAAAGMGMGAKSTVTPAKLAAVFQPDANMERAAVPDAYKWNLAPLFKDDQAFEAALSAVSAQRAKLAAYKGTLADPAKLRECLDLYFATRLETNRLTLYSNLRFDSDQQSTTLQALKDRALTAMNDLQALAAFIRQEVLKLDDGAVKAALAKEPKLAAYKPYLEEMRRRRTRVLSEDAERVLALAGDNLWAEIDLNELPSDYEKIFDAAQADIRLPTIKDEAGKDVQLTLSNYPRYRASTDRRVRQDAVEGLFGALKQHQHIFAGTLGGQVRLNILMARSRGYDTALQAYMDKDNLDPAVYTNLVTAVHKNVAPLHRYVELRKKVMGLTDLHIYDLYTPLVAKAQVDIPYEQATRIIPEALAPLGPEYVKVLRTGFDSANGWVDVFPHKNKDSGAFCASIHGTHPFVKMNYMNDFDGLSTLAHEFGHAMHSHLAMNSQPYVTSNYSTLIAETASTFNEKLLSDHLVKTAKSKEEKLAVLGKLVESIRTTIYRQTLFSEFELAVHTAAEQGTPVTSEFLNKTYGDLVRAYYGPGFTVGDNDDVEWAYIPHFYYKYYVYSYANGLSAGIALAEKVQSGNVAAREAYLGMLKGGSSKPPVELMRGAGVDLTRPDAVEAAARLLDRTLAEMEKLLGVAK